MAPMAGGVSHGEEDGFVLLPCLFKSFLTPRIPDGEVGVVQLATDYAL